jgi:hypothetical protein
VHIQNLVTLFLQPILAKRKITERWIAKYSKFLSIPAFAVLPDMGKATGFNKIFIASDFGNRRHRHHPADALIVDCVA